MKITLTVNGAAQVLEIDGRMLLVEVLRDALDLKGTRIGCLTGDCGACTVTFNGELRKSCLMLAQAADGGDIRTIELRNDIIDALRTAFVERHGFQCGYCTSGMLMVATDLLERNSAATADDIRRAIGGNLCRCTGYDPIIDAVMLALARIGSSKPAAR